MLLPLSADCTAAYKPVTAVTSPSYKAPSNGEGGDVEGIKETMSGSETELEMGLMTNTTGEPLGVGLLKSPGTTQPAPLNVLLPFSDDGAAADKPVTTAISTANQAPSNEGEVVWKDQPAELQSHPMVIANMNMKNKGSVSGTLEKKKRGRKRKYGPGGTLESALVAASQSVNQTTVGVSPSSPHPPPPAGAAAVTSPHAAAESISPTGSKKARVRPYASKKKQQHEGLGCNIKIMSFSLRGQRDICIMSANGTLSSVTLREQAISGGTTTYEGLFQILSLSGVFLPSENGDKRSRTGGLSVSLSGPDGRVLGGGVAGLLTAASPVQVLVASFKSDGGQETSARL
ncbi:hypothetical protein GH714_007452 [Hevea brasiliensis]|uniref:AT-hook motif nuclear-localized protein n=1 Tax=Hevea brasiliensis TaxID=3981 RepID=A0A6A6M989_HEVBR|nr:hypothetical protein GH714_007452 [Hevea brasiliensis]